jgi:membrane protein
VLALPVLFLLWLWVTWIIVLFGLELSYVMQGIKAGTFKREQAPDEQDMIVDPRMVLPLLMVVGRRFDEGKTIDATELSRKVGLQVRTVDFLVDRLLEEGLMHRVAGRDDGRPELALARSPQRVKVDQLLRLGRKLTSNGKVAPDVPGQDLLDRLVTAETREAGDATLADLIERQDSKTK